MVDTNVVVVAKDNKNALTELQAIAAEAFALLDTGRQISSFSAAVLSSISTMQVSVGDQIRVTAGFREGKNVFKNNDIAEVREITNTGLVLNDRRRMRRNGARIDQGVCITLMQANAVRSIRWSCCRTALTQKAGM